MCFSETSPRMVSVAILGSCVTRDAFALPAGSGYEIDEYFARSALASATADQPFTDFDDSAIESPFQRRIVALDHGISLLGHVTGHSFDVFVYDMIDERFDLVQHAGQIATRSNEVTLGTSVTEPEKPIASGSDEFFSMWGNRLGTLDRHAYRCRQSPEVADSHRSLGYRLGCLTFPEGQSKRSQTR